MSEWQKCPVCEGKGLVPNNFYTAIGVNPYSTSSITPEQCRTCSGKGVLLVPKESPLNPDWEPPYETTCDCDTCESKQ